jgi:hypothetical protein
MDPKLLRAEELGVRLEIVQGLPIREPYPVYKHLSHRRNKLK